MIDVENIIFDRLSKAIRDSYSGASVYGEFVELPASFPCVTIVEADNHILERMRDLDGIEHYVQVMYEINIYTNDASGKKSKAKAIAALIDEQMSALQFTRTYRGQTPNVDRTIYRITLRYSGVVREPQEIDGKIVYLTYSSD